MYKKQTWMVAAALALTVACNDTSTNPASAPEATSSPAVTPGGAVMASMHSFRAVLSGEDAGTDSKARGVTTFRTHADGMAMDFRFAVANLHDVTMAHIHISETPGGSGPPAVWLYPSGPPPQLIEGRSSGIISEGTITASDLIGPLEGMAVADLMTAINEGRAYVNVHTDAHPGGEIRGQVE